MPKGILVIIGGKENKGQDKDPKDPQKNFIKLEVLKTFTDLVEDKKGIVEVITTASAVGDEMIAEYQELFKDLGFNNVGHIHHKTRNEVLESDLTERLMKANAFFFTGGDQLLLTSIYGGTSFIKILKDRYIYENVVIGGTSAGAMALSTPMIYAGNNDVQEIGGEIKVTTGLEFVKDVLIDTHFIDRGRFIRMAQVVATNPNCIGIGIDEDTAIVVRNGTEAEVVGSALITIVEGFKITKSNMDKFDEKEPVEIHDLNVHILPRGAKYMIPEFNPPHK